MKATTTRTALAALTLLALTTSYLAARAQDKPRTSRAEFMRMKLEYSKRVLEGLTLENYATIQKNAKALKTLSEAAEWEVPTIPDVNEYLAFTTEFQKLSSELAKKAAEKNIDGATLTYLKLTMNCVNCDKYVRQSLK